MEIKNDNHNHRHRQALNFPSSMKIPLQRCREPQIGGFYLPDEQLLIKFFKLNSYKFSFLLTTCHKVGSFAVCLTKPGSVYPYREDSGGCIML